MDFTVEPVPGLSHEGRQWGWTIKKASGTEVLHATTGGTGACWNIATDDEDEAMHVCDLDDLIAALTALRDSDAHRMHVERWSA